jgi:hypothetical protein
MSVKAPNAVIQQVERLVDEHRQLRDEPLLLAAYFEPARSPGDVFLFEVIDGFGAGSIDEDRKLFEVAYASTPSFPLPSGHHLHLILTNPEELEVAYRQGWPSLDEVRAAVRAGNSVTVFSDPSRPDLEGKING